MMGGGNHVFLLFPNSPGEFHPFFLMFTPRIGEDESILTSICFKRVGLFNHQPAQGLVFCECGRKKFRTLRGGLNMNHLH